MRRGLKPVLGGRDPRRVRALAESLGLPWRAAALDEPAALRAALDGIELVLHLAGPFSATSATMVSACLDARAHYLDITGEPAVFEACYARHEEAVRAGVCLLPGVGFDVVPTDGLAALLHRRLPGATHLDLAVGGLFDLSPGTARTVVEGLPGGVCTRRDGELLRQPFGRSRRRLPFPSGERLCLAAPLADVVSSFRATGIPNIATWLAVTQALAVLARGLGLLAPLLSGRIAQGALQGLAARLARGPDAERRASARFEVYGEVRDAAGGRAAAALITPEPYAFTVEAALACVARAHELPAGAHTPSQALGPEFIRSFASVAWCEI